MPTGLPLLILAYSSMLTVFLYHDFHPVQPIHLRMNFHRKSANMELMKSGPTCQPSFSLGKEVAMSTADKEMTLVLTEHPDGIEVAIAIPLQSFSFHCIFSFHFSFFFSFLSITPRKPWKHLPLCGVINLPLNTNSCQDSWMHAPVLSNELLFWCKFIGATRNSIILTWGAYNKRFSAPNFYFKSIFKFGMPTFHFYNSSCAHGI